MSDVLPERAGGAGSRKIRELDVVEAGVIAYYI
jgi:hypothetical protein